MSVPTSPQLVFSPLAIHDAKYFLDELQGIDTFLSVNAPKTLEDAQQLVNGYLQEIQEGKQVRFIIKNQGGNLVGCIGLYNLGTDDTELQLWIAKKFQNSGYGFEIGKSFLDWIYKNIDFKIIYAAFDEKNVASRKLAEKLGGVPGMMIPKPVFQPESGKTLQIIWYEFRK